MVALGLVQIVEVVIVAGVEVEVVVVARVVGVHQVLAVIDRVYHHHLLSVAVVVAVEEEDPDHTVAALDHPEVHGHILLLYHLHQVEAHTLREVALINGERGEVDPPVHLQEVAILIEEEVEGGEGLVVEGVIVVEVAGLGVHLLFQRVRELGQGVDLIRVCKVKGKEEEECVLDQYPHIEICPDQEVDLVQMKGAESIREGNDAHVRQVYHQIGLAQYLLCQAQQKESIIVNQYLRLEIKLDL